jgi:hypothetical protein
MDDRQQTPSGGKSSHCLWQGELTKIKYMAQKSFAYNFHFLGGWGAFVLDIYY